MATRRWGYPAFLAACAALLVGLLLVRSPPLDWSFTLDPERATPFAARVFDETLEAHLPGRTVLRPDATASVVLDTLRAPATLLVLDPGFDPGAATVRRLMTFARRGGTVVVATQYVGMALADTLGIESVGLGRPFDVTEDLDTLGVRIGAVRARVPARLVAARVQPQTHWALDVDTTRVTPAPSGVAFAFAESHVEEEDELLDEPMGYGGQEQTQQDTARQDSASGWQRTVPAEPLDPAAIDSIDRQNAASSDAEESDPVEEDSHLLRRAASPEDALDGAGVDEGEGDLALADSAVIGVRFDVGAGRVVLFSAPHLLTNYGMLYGGGAALVPGLLAYAAPEGPVVWPHRLRTDAPGEGTPLSYVLGHPAFRPAWRTAFVALLLAMAFRVRRRQRAIPYVAPPRNASAAFARVVGRLYYQRGNHAHLARTLRRQFHAYARDTLGVPTGPGEADFVADVAARAAATPETVADLVRRLDAVPDDDRMPPRTLLALARDLDAFYAHSPRGRP